MSIVLYMVSILMAIGMFSMLILRKIVEFPPKNIDSNAIIELEKLVNIYYSGDVSIRFYIVLIMGGSIISEAFHYLLHFGRV